MMNRLVCIALLCAALVSAHGGSNGGGGPNRGPRPDYGNKDRWTTALCANDTLAQSFLSQTQQLLTTLQSNGSFAEVLAKRAQEIAYIQDSNNAAVLSSNCTGYFSGLSNARDLDRQAEEVRRQYYRIVGEAFFQIIRSLVGDDSYYNRGY